MKVLITTDWYAPVINGVVTSVLMLRRELEARGHEVRIVTLSNSMHSYKDGNVYYMGSVSANRIYPGARLKMNRAGSLLRELAEEHIRRLTRLRGRESQVLRLLDIEPRPLVERERSYIAAWDSMGFDDSAIRLAYEKTVLKKQSMNWSYMNAILCRWHEKGLHTAAAVQAGDRDPKPAQAERRQVPDPDQERRTRENMERTRRLMEQMKQEEN